MKNADKQQVLSTLLSLFVGSKGQPVEWGAIRAGVSSRVTVTNWLRVRGVLQYLIDEGAVVRDHSDLNVERYLTTDAFKAANPGSAA